MGWIFVVCNDIIFYGQHENGGDRRTRKTMRWVDEVRDHCAHVGAAHEVSIDEEVYGPACNCCDLPPTVHAYVATIVYLQHSSL